MPELHEVVNSRATHPTALSKMSASVAALALATLASAMPRLAGASSPSCPCLQTAAWPVLGTDSGGASCNRVLTGGELHCYPATYGLGGCAAHDATREPHCDGASPAGFCAEPWCYVDPDACRGSVKRFHQSDVLIDAGVSAFYSYDTCGGDEESWNDVMVSSVLSGKTLRAAVAVPYYYPDHYVEGADGQPLTDVASYRASDLPAGATVKGIWIDFYSKIAERANFALDWRPVSGGSKAAHSSSFTACAQDVADGIVDLCIGDYWTTEERLGMTTFTTGVLTDTFSVIHPKPVPEPTTLAHRLKMAGAPFSLELWMTCLAVCVGTGVMYNILRVGYREYLPMDLRRSEMSGGQRARAWAQGSAAYTFAAFLEFTSQDVQAKYDASGNPVPDRMYELNLVKMAWSLFSMFVLLFYTASLTAGMVSDNLGSVGITTLEECQARRCVVCVPGVMMPTMQRLYKDKINFHASTSSTNVFRDLENGECVLGLMIERRFNTMWSSGEYGVDDVCAFDIGEAVMPIGCSQPIRQEYAAALSYWAKKVADEDFFLGALIEETYMPAPPCPMLREEAFGNEPLGVADMFAPLLVYAILIFLALMSRGMFTYHKHKASFKSFTSWRIFSKRSSASSAGEGPGVFPSPSARVAEDEKAPAEARA